MVSHSRHAYPEILLKWLDKVLQSSKFQALKSLQPIGIPYHINSTFTPLFPGSVNNSSP